MREYAKVSPSFWIDGSGISKRVPEIKGRLKCGKIPLHRALRDFVLERDGWTCRNCGKTKEDGVLLVADHIVSRRNGGTHHPNNLQCLCDSCNAKKAALVDGRIKRVGV